MPSAISRLLERLLKRRLPFIGLAIAAVMGIVAAYFLPIPAIAYGVTAIVLAVGVFIFHRTILCLAMTFCVFAAVFLWQTRESAAERLAEILDGQKTVVAMEGHVDEAPTVRGDYARFVFHASKVIIDNREIRLPFPVLVSGKHLNVGIGDPLRIIASLQRIPRARNPGEFDARAWYWLQGIYFEAKTTRPEDVSPLPSGEGGFLKRNAWKLREWMMHELGLGISDDVEVTSVLQTLTLGSVAGVSPSIEEAFRKTGTYHLFSVSGLHVAMLAAILWYFLRLVRVRRRWAVALIVIAVFGYALITGWKPATLRAAMMASVVLVGMLASRPAQIFNSLGAAAFLILLMNPRDVFNPGFQLSFVVVAAIVLVASPLQKLLRPRFEADPFIPKQLVSARERFLRRLSYDTAGMVCVSVAAFFGSLPLIVGYFHNVSFSSIPANLFAVPLSFLILCLAMISLACGIVSPWLAAVFNNANWLLVKTLLAGITALAGIPGSSINMGGFRNAPAEMLVFDMGMGGAIAIHSGKETWLVDCGNEFYATQVVAQYLRAQEISDLDALVLSHGDARHIGGAESLLEIFPARRVIDSTAQDRSPYRKRLNAYLAERKILKTAVRSGNALNIGGGNKIKILHPPDGAGGRMADDKALVLLLEIAGTRVLMMSDAGYFTERVLLESGADIHADILISGGESGHREFLSVVRPSAIIVARDAHSPRESVHQDGARRYFLDETGAIRIQFFENRWEIFPFLSDEKTAHRFDSTDEQAAQSDPGSPEPAY